MEEFLASLTPSLRGKVEAALESDPDHRIRLTSVAGRYIDAEGNWPTNVDTAEMVARQFLSTVETVETQYAGAGLGTPLVAGLAGGALSVVGAKGAVVVSSNLMANYWQEIVAYNTGLHPVFVRGLKKFFDHVSRDTHWAQLARDLTPQQVDPNPFSMVFGSGFEQMIEREVIGAMKKSAWQGARSALNHITGGRIGDFANENPWVESYVGEFARGQAETTERTMREIVLRGQEQGLGSRAMADRLRQSWDLNPRYALAVENYRKGLMRQERSPKAIREQTERYAQRLRASRVSAMARTEMLTTFHLGREAQWRKAVQRGDMPIDTKKMWVTAKDELVCPICRPMDGQAVDIGDPFQGEVTLYAPSAHPNCRCIIIPVSSADEPTLVFPDAVSKHLIGQHDQKTHGKKGFRQSHSRSTHKPFSERAMQGLVGADSWSEATTGDKVLLGLAGAYAGMILLPLAPLAVPLASATFKGVKNLPKLPGQIHQNIKTAQQFKALPEGDKIAHLASYMNNGGKITPGMKKAFPQADDLAKGIKKWTSGDQNSIREYLITGGASKAGAPVMVAGKPTSAKFKGMPEYDALGMAIASSADAGTDLWRGMDASGDVLKAFTTKGNTFKLGPTGFSSNKGIANMFAKDKFGFGGSGEPIVFRLAPDSRALRIEKEATAVYKFEKEWLTAGTFRVNKATKDSKGVWQIEISQTELMVPNVYKLPTTSEMLKAQQQVKKMGPQGGLTMHDPKTYSDVIGPEWWKHYGISDELIEQSGLLTHGWLKPEHALALAKRLGISVDEVFKHMGPGPHPSGTEQTIHSGKDDEEGEFLWDLTTRVLTGGDVTSRKDLTTEMRKRNRRASGPLRAMRNGKITNFSTRKLGLMTEGVGFRIGNENHIKTFANKIMAGEDVFRFRGRRDPVMVLVYDDGAQVLDGKHRLAAAQMAGEKKVPVQVARVRRPTPEPETFREEWDELRRNVVRYQHQHKQLPPKRPSEPFDVRTPYRTEVAFNEWMATRAALRDEERFLRHGVRRGERPSLFSRN